MDKSVDPFIEINGRRVGSGHPIYVIAEMSANHNQDYDHAVRIIHAIKESGADAVKLQTYTPDTLTIDCDNENFQITGTLWSGRTLYDLYSEAYMPWDWYPKLKAVAEDIGIDLFSTPYDPSAVEFLEDMDMPVFKIASFENVDLPLLRRMAQTGKPIIMSTGMATLFEIDEGVRTIRDSGGTQLALLKCTSAYPAPPEETNLRAISHLADTFGLPVGLSDHTLGTAVPIAAVAQGACIIEKHVTLNRGMDGPDSRFSLEPGELKFMVDSIRLVEKALGSISYGDGEEESKSKMFRRSLFVVNDIKAGDKLTSENIRSIRPGYGLHTRYFEKILGRRASMDITRGTPLDWNLIS